MRLSAWPCSRQSEAQIWFRVGGAGGESSRTSAVSSTLPVSQESVISGPGVSRQSKRVTRRGGDFKAENNDFSRLQPSALQKGVHLKGNLKGRI